MLLVDGLTCHPEGFGHLGPCPTLAHRALDLGVLEPIGHRPEGRGRGQSIGGTTKGGRHASNSSCLVEKCQLTLLRP